MFGLEEQESRIVGHWLCPRGYQRCKSRISFDRMTKVLKFRPSSLLEIFAIVDYYFQPGLLSTPPQSQLTTGLELPADIKSKGHKIPQLFYNPLFRYTFQKQSLLFHPCKQHLRSNRSLYPRHL